MTVQPLPTVPPAQPEPVKTYNHWWYCLEDSHPGVLSYASQPFDMGRIFGTETDQAPIRCPGCGDARPEGVSAIPTPGPNVPPPSVLEYSQRFRTAQLTGGNR